jgi:hypothetical protein
VCGPSFGVVTDLADLIPDFEGNGYILLVKFHSSIVEGYFSIVIGGKDQSRHVGPGYGRGVIRGVRGVGMRVSCIDG